MNNLPRWSFVLLALYAAAALAQGTADSPIATPQAGLEHRGPAQMTAADSQLVQSRSTDIARAAEIYGYTLDGSWSYQQAVCPVASNHVLLNYNRQERDGSISSFSATVPRHGQTVEIFPVLRSGYSPYAHAWGEHSYAVFNSLMTAERKGVKTLDLDSAFSVPWKEWALCYVALVSSPPAGSMAPFELASEITIVVGDHRTAQVGFTARDGEMSYSDWGLRFSSKGLLLGADRVQHNMTFTPAGLDPLLPVHKKQVPEPASLPAQPQSH
jgi:hypothetical protein